MKRLLVSILTVVLMHACLTACNIFIGKVTCEPDVSKEDTYIVYKFENFLGTFHSKVTRSHGGEGVLHSRAELTRGELSVSKWEGWLVGNEHIFSIKVGEVLLNCDIYIEGKEFLFIFEADSPVTGEVIISFAPIEEHEHTYQWLTNETSHQKKYTCQCNTRDLTEFHSDNDENKICDVCGYIMTGHQHTFVWGKDEISHCYSYTCGCPTPPNAALHSDGDSDGKCDVCEYTMEDKEGK